MALLELPRGLTPADLSGQRDKCPSSEKECYIQVVIREDRGMQNKKQAETEDQIMAEAIKNEKIRRARLAGPSGITREAVG